MMTFMDLSILSSTLHLFSDAWNNYCKFCIFIPIYIYRYQNICEEFYYILRPTTVLDLHPVYSIATCF